MADTGFLCYKAAMLGEDDKKDAVCIVSGYMS